MLNETNGEVREIDNITFLRSFMVEQLEIKNIIEEKRGGDPKSMPEIKRKFKPLMARHLYHSGKLCLYGDMVDLCDDGKTLSSRTF